ncbi:MAG TPA: hypothetical protein VFD60_10585 [Nitrososphaeraceae archaeon]|nr:hypothetical protein [Nitrososphaeraceae archaeon]
MTDELGTAAGTDNCCLTKFRCVIMPFVSPATKKEVMNAAVLVPLVTVYEGRMRKWR